MKVYIKRFSPGFLYPLAALILLILVLSQKVFMAPPLGELLNPFKGIVQNEKEQTFNRELSIGRKSPIEIAFDERSIPHIFAGNQADMFFAQGYVTAANRLWQMDFLSYVSAGRLSEILGENMLGYDRHQRRLGLLAAAKASLGLIESDPEIKQALDHYTQGVNNYIAQLSDAELPLEYKLMDYRPEPWTNLKSVLIMKYMGALLSGYEEDLVSSYLLAALGKTQFDRLFSNYLISGAPGRFSIARVNDSLPSRAYIDFSFLESSPQIRNSTFDPRLGSNSWAIAPQKSASGSAILCNDPHLNLSLPAVWYELQLRSDETNVYGYSIPGTPGVIIGYNEHISWGLTNGSVDVRDLFKLELRPDYSQYKFDGVWKNTEQTIEEIKLRNGKPFYDTVFYTVHGPIASDFRFGPRELSGMATKWTLYDPSNEFRTFIQLNRAVDYGQFKEALQYYKCPVQSFSYADVNGNIALQLQGKILKSRWQGRGRFILDGTVSEHLSKEVLSHEIPSVKNPEQGFVCSANNNPFHEHDPFYASGHYSELRSDKIKQLLSQPQKFTVDDMKRMQLDNTNRLAELALPVLLEAMPKTGNIYLQKLRTWDYKCEKQTELAFLFEQWWKLIRNNTWDELKRFPKVNRQPDDLVLLDLIVNDPSNRCFDNLSTDKKETAADIIRGSFETLTENWLVLPVKWEHYNKADLIHLSKLPALSREKIASAGHPNAINALANNWGPSLRFVVEMGKVPQGYGIYAGGQSGNPASKAYDSFVGDWNKGNYYKLNFFLTEEESIAKTLYKWTIK